MVLKTKIINPMFRLLIEYGLITVRELQENMNISKSTIYKYINNLKKLNIISDGWVEYEYELVRDNVKIVCQLRRIK